MLGRGALVVAIGIVAAGCGGDGDVDVGAPTAPEGLVITSSAFAEGETIPLEFTCDGDNVSPPLEWSGVPQQAAELALFVEDPDAPGGTFTHWVLFGIELGVTGVSKGKIPPNAKEGATSLGTTGYTGPCPPSGAEPHRYVFTLSALSASLALEDGAAAEDVAAAVADVALVQGSLTGLFGR